MRTRALHERLVSARERSIPLHERSCDAPRALRVRSKSAHERTLSARRAPQSAPRALASAHRTFMSATPLTQPPSQGSPGLTAEQRASIEAKKAAAAAKLQQTLVANAYKAAAAAAAGHEAHRIDLEEAVEIAIGATKKIKPKPFVVPYPKDKDGNRIVPPHLRSPPSSPPARQVRQPHPPPVKKSPVKEKSPVKTSPVKRKVGPGDPDWPLDDDPHTTQAVGEFETDVAYNDWDVPEKSGLLVPVVAKQTGELNPFEKAKTVLQQRKRKPPSTPSTPESPTRPPLSPTTPPLTQPDPPSPPPSPFVKREPQAASAASAAAANTYYPSLMDLPTPTQVVVKKEGRRELSQSAVAIRAREARAKKKIIKLEHQQHPAIPAPAPAPSWPVQLPPASPHEYFVQCMMAAMQDPRVTARVQAICDATD